MEDGASRIFDLFDLSDTSLLAHMSAAYPHPHISWMISLPPPDLLSCVISTLSRKPYKQELHQMLASRSSTNSGETSAPPSQSIMLSRIHPSLVSRPSKSTGTVYDMPNRLGQKSVSQA